MQLLAKTQKVTSIEEFKTYAGMDRFVVLPEGYETKVGLWTLVNAVTNQETPDAFNMSSFDTEYGQLSSYCDRLFSPLDTAFHVFMLDYEDKVIVFDEYKDLEKYAEDEEVVPEEVYTLYLTEEFLDQLIEIDKEEKQAWCKCKINAAKVKIESFEKRIAQYEEILAALQD